MQVGRVLIRSRPRSIPFVGAYGAAIADHIGTENGSEPATVRPAVVVTFPDLASVCREGRLKIVGIAVAGDLVGGHDLVEGSLLGVADALEGAATALKKRGSPGL